MGEIINFGGRGYLYNRSLLDLWLDTNSKTSSLFILVAFPTPMVGILSHTFNLMATNDSLELSS